MRRRLVWAIAGVATAAVVLFAVPLALLLGDAQRTSDLLRLQRDTFAATREIDLSGDASDAVEIPASRDLLGVYDRSGRRVAGRGPARAPDVVLRALRTGRATDAAGGGVLVVAVPLLSGERVAGAVRAERSVGESAGDTTQERLLVGALALGVVLVAVLAALWLGRVLARPLERLAAVAARLGGGDFASRAPVAGIPEVDAVGAALAGTARRLEDMVERERRFSADASHQLRTPLQALRIELEGAQLRGDAPPEVDGALAQVERLEATIATLLAVARDAPRRHASTRVAGVLDAAQARWHGPLAASSRPLRLDPGDEGLTADADERVVGEVLDILLDNAFRHGTGAVGVTVRRPEGAIAIDVADDGPGFDGADPFVRRDPAAGGHGIGLALAQSLAHAEGGRVAVTSPGPAPVVTLFLRPAGPSRT